MPDKSTTPMVSVCCITYNHEQFLAQTIESVLMQQTTFAVELVIGEDCSPDRTRQIALDYQTRYPDRIRVLLPEKNLGIMGNLMATMGACTGRYIAFVEGDDYWTDPLKLQRQVDLMEAQPECSLCIHDAEVFTEDNSQPPYLFSSRYPIFAPAGGGRITQAELVRHGWGIASASMLFRSSSLTLPLPEWYRQVFSGDYTLQLLSTRSGYIYYLPQVMSRYRLHSGGVMQTSNNTLMQNGKRIFENEQYKRLLPSEFHYAFDKYLEHLYFERSEKMKAAGSRWQQLYYYYKAATINPERLRFHLSRLVKRVTLAR
ncbi:glycosyltransferase [Hymenobacter sp. BT175]|uniref:glycosyltransferase n=1 Tax=Hymenobacter translucens TaxID=2886507 RepID=UPI001D0DF648|nr:glycosyltransferase [Hymenobacter translucens]MCC2547910.1 glycosyltransferase [Hymenobacter translucens]